MRDQRSYSELLYQYETLRARLKIRDHYVKTAVKEVYDNVGQVLSFIRVQLSILRLSGDTGKMDASGELVGQTIRDLRDMCQLLYPETDIVNVPGFNRAIEHEVKALYPQAVWKVDEKDLTSGVIDNEKGVILFGILLEILAMIGTNETGGLDSMTLKYDQHTIEITADYRGVLISRMDRHDKTGTFDLSIFERAELLGGKLEIKNIRDDGRRIKLVIPIN